MDNNKFIKAFDYAKNNPNTEFAIELRKRIALGEYNSQLSQMGVDTANFKKPEEKKQGFFSRIGNALIKNEKAFGESIAGAIIPFTSAQKSLDEAREQREQTQNQLISRIQEGRSKGEDVTKWVGLLKDLSGQKIMSDAELNPALLKTNKQVLGEALGVATDIIGAGTIAGKGAQLVTKPTSFVGGAIQGAKTGAVTGASFGAAQGVATGMQENLGGAGIATRGITGGIVGGAVGGFLGGATGGISGAVRGNQLRREELKNLISSGEISDARLAKVGLEPIQDEVGNVTYKLSGRDKAATEAVKQGFDDADIAIIKTAGNTDKAKMKNMFSVAEKASTNRKVVERPYDIVGESVLEPVKKLNGKLKTSVTELDGVAKGLKGQAVNRADDVVLSMQDDLSGLGASLDDKGNISFKGSDLEGLGGNERLINNVWKRIQSADDAYDWHRIKRFIDSNVDYGKSSEGLTGQAESLLKGWRKQIDGALDTQFIDYNRVNTTISDIFGLLDEMNSVLGRKFRIGDDLANLRAGQVASRLLGNNATRGDIMNMLNNISKVSNKYGIKTDQDIISQVVFADVLEDLFGTQATRGLQGQVQRAVRDGAVDVLQRAGDKNLLGATLEIGKKALEKTRGINQENKIKAIKTLLGI